MYPSLPAQFQQQQQARDYGMYKGGGRVGPPPRPQQEATSDTDLTKLVETLWLVEGESPAASPVVPPRDQPTRGVSNGNVAPRQQQHIPPYQPPAQQQHHHIPPYQPPPPQHQHQHQPQQIPPYQPPPPQRANDKLVQMLREADYDKGLEAVPPSPPRQHSAPVIHYRYDNSQPQQQQQQQHPPPPPQRQPPQGFSYGVPPNAQQLFGGQQTQQQQQYSPSLQHAARSPSAVARSGTSPAMYQYQQQQQQQQYYSPPADIPASPDLTQSGGRPPPPGRRGTSPLTQSMGGTPHYFQQQQQQSSPPPPQQQQQPRNRAPSRAVAKFASFGCTLDQLMRDQYQVFPEEPLPKVFTTLLQMIRSNNGLVSEGIFRVSGALSEITRLKDSLNKGAFDMQFSGDCNTPACALKQWITELKEPLIPRNFYDAVLDPVRNNQPQRLGAVLSSLPTVNYEVLRTLMAFLREVLAFSDRNRMTSSSLAIVFAPGIFGSNIADPFAYLQNAQSESKCMELMLQNV